MMKQNPRSARDDAAVLRGTLRIPEQSDQPFNGVIIKFHSLTPASLQRRQVGQRGRWKGNSGSRCMTTTHRNSVLVGYDNNSDHTDRIRVDE